MSQLTTKPAISPVEVYDLVEEMDEDNLDWLPIGESEDASLQCSAESNAPLPRLRYN